MLPDSEPAAAPDVPARLAFAFESARTLGRIPQIILDLDGTLFDNVPRTQRILHEVARELLGPDDPVTRLIDGLQGPDHEYSPVDTLRAAGIHDEELLFRLREGWASRFFDSSYLAHDEPLAGAVDAARRWWELGAELNYLTGRHVPDMFLGTCASLHDAGFPIGTIRTQLLMKPEYEMNDVTFKLETVPAIREKGPIVLLVDNDPRVINPLAEAVPEAIAVMVRTLHPKDAPELASGVPVVDDFRTLIGSGT
jgi:hypothetical protein